MSQSDRAIKKLATQLARLDREVKSWRGAQADYTSIEAGTMDINDSDGNLVSRVGFQDDGSGAVRFFDGPTPPVPAGVTATADGPIIQATWDGTFEGGAEATYDLAYLEVAATQVDDASNVSFATITAKEGASASVVADVTGDWVVAVRSVSQAGKKSEFATAGTVEVKVTDLSGAIEDVQQSANGKNQVHYSTEPPTEADAGIVGDTWWVGMDGRPEEVLATNLATNPSFTSLNNQIGGGTMSASSGTAVIVTADWSESGDTALKVTPTASANTTAVDQMTREDTATAADAGKTFTISANIHLEAAQTGSLWQHPRRIVVRSRYGGFTSSSYAYSDSAPNEPGTHRVSVTFTLQPNTEWWYFMLTNGSSTVPVFWDSIIVEEGSGSGQYFDGDTPSGTSDNDPHYRWTGAPHASTSEQFLPEIGSGAWNITEQYQYTADGWTQVELSHEVIATVDLGKATVGELDGIRIMARTMSSDVFTGTAFEGYIFKGTTFQTTNGSEFSDRGLFLYDEDGNPRIQAPVDGSDFTVNAEIIARSLTSTGRASFLAEDNRIEPGAGLVLAAGVGDPASPPVVSTYYPEVTAPLENTDRGVYALAWADNHFWRWVENGNTTGNRGRLEKITTSGDIVASYNTGGFLARNGAVGIGDELFLLGPKSGDNDRRWVQVYGTDGAYKREWQYTSHVATSKYDPGIGCDEDGNVVIAHCWSVDGALTWRTFNPATGAQTAQFDSPDKTRSNINGIYVGSADFGVKRAVVAKASGPSGFRQFPVFNATTGAYVPGESWHSPHRDDPRGLVWDGEKFHTSDPSGTVSEFSTLTTGDNTSNWWGVYRWAKDLDEDLTIDLSSRISPPARFSWPRRARLKVTAPNLPQGAGEIAPSLAYKTTTPTRTDFHSPNWWSVTDEPSAYYYELPELWYLEPSPADGNNFPDGDPSVLSAASGLFEVKGDGSGSWGPLTFNADGTMTSTQIPDWVPITSFLNSASPAATGFAPAYRVWPDGKAEWRGAIQFPSTTSTTELLTVPPEARPVSDVHVAAAAQSPSTGAARIDVCDPNAPTALRVVPGGSKNWVSLDGLYYYLT